jgi:predicted DNA-binding protein with PD1-like motif
MKSKTLKPTKVIVARCDAGEDLYHCLSRLVQKHDIKSGHFQVMGAVSRCMVGIFKKGEYQWLQHEGELEISSCIGNVALKKDKPFVHCHAVLTDNEGHVVAGHVGEGCIISPTAEIHMVVHEGEVERSLDEPSGLWTLNI